ncbi:MAG: PAS domain S-box protein [Desulfobacteraceae bacterium]|nr:MAG: PAS domain S-box protein [Desulfobacteraceae bacterium]
MYNIRISDFNSIFDILFFFARDKNKSMKNIKRRPVVAINEDVTQIEKLTLELQRSEERYRRILSAVTDYIFTVYVENARVVKTVHGPACISITGYSEEEYYADPNLWHTMILEEDRDRVKTHASLILSGKDPGTIEHRIRCKNGKIRWISNTPVLQRDSSGALISYDGLIKDITGRVKAEEEIRLNTSRLQSLVNILQHRFDSIQDFLDYTLDKAIMLTGSKIGYIYFYHEDRREFVLNTWSKDVMKECTITKPQTCYELDKTGIWGEAVRQRKEIIVNNYQAVHPLKKGYPEGHAMLYKYLTVPVFNDDKIVAVVGVANKSADYNETDVLQLTLLMDAVWKVVEQNKAVELHRALSSRHEALLSAIPDMIMEVDINKIYTWTNQTGIEFFGEDVIGKEAAFYFEGEQETYQSVKPLFNGNHNIIYVESWQRRKDGQKRLLAWLCKVLKDERGNVTGAISSAHDITDQKRAEAEKSKLEEQYRQAQKMEAIGQLAGGVAHDFNNMLNIILGYSQIALMKIDQSSPLQADIREIMNAAKRSTDLVRQLLAFARKQTIAPKVLDFNDAISSMLKMLRKLIGEDIDLLWKPAANLWPVKMDPTQIDQILTNLAVNARDSISGVGKITIETGSVEFDDSYCAMHTGFIAGKYVLLAVSDNGCGMDKETLEKVFDPFFTTKKFGEGTGMGLATVYGIVKQNNGFINVYSESGKGTTFRIYLPLHEDKDAAIDKPKEHTKPLTGTETVLIVEDEKVLLKLGKVMLEELGYNVLAASAPGEAIRMVEEHTGDIHLVLTDVVMPEMSGRDLQRRISELRPPDLRFLFMSGYTANVIAHRGILDKGVNMLQKPFSMNDLASKVREALEKEQETGISCQGSGVGYRGSGFSCQPATGN